MKNLHFDKLENKCLLSPANPLTPAFGGLTEPEYLQYELILLQRELDLNPPERFPLEPDWDAIRDKVLKDAFKPEPLPFETPMPEEPGIGEFYLQVIDEVIQAISPPSHPIMITP